MNEYRIEVKVKNNLIIKKLEERGYSTVGEFCRLNNVDNSTLGDIINLKKSPLNAYGRWIPLISKLCKVLGCEPEELFTGIQLNTILKSNKKVIEIKEAELQFTLDRVNSTKLLEEEHYNRQISSSLANTISRLPQREQQILNMYYGLGEYDKTHTLKQIGDCINLSPVRVRDHLARSLRKLRHPIYSKQLRSDLEMEG